MSHEEFWNIYTTSTAEVKKNNQVFSMSVPKIVDGTTEVGTATKKIVWEFTHGELKAIGAGGSQFVATITVKNKLQSSKYPDKITFKFIVNVKLPVATLESVKNELFWQNIDGELKFFKVNAEVPDTPEDPADGCLIHQELGLAYDKYDVKGLPTCVTHRYVVTKTYSDGKATSKVLAGVKIDGETISLDKDGANATAVKAALNSAGGLQASVAHIYTLESGGQITVNEFMVNFIRPVSLNMPSGVTLTDAVTGGDIANFQWNGLLMDWSGNAIVSPSVVETEDISSYWKRVCVPEYELTEGHYNIVTPASLKTTTGTVDIVTASPITTYNGSATYTYTQITDGTTTTTKTYTTPHSMVTKGEVSNYLYAQALNGAPAGYRLTANGTVNYTEVLVSAGSSITYTYIASIDYTPAVIEWIPGEPVAKSMTIHCSLISKEHRMARNQDAGNGLRLHSVAQLLISDNTGSIMENSVR